MPPGFANSCWSGRKPNPPSMSYRYLGNKTRLLDWIVPKILKRVGPGAQVADPMCGTASVARALAANGLSLAMSDALSFPIVHADATVVAKRAPAFSSLTGYQEAVAELNELPGEAGYFAREFGADGSPASGRAPRLYFSADNARRIDAIRRRIANWVAAGTVDALERSVLLQSLLLATNRVANIAGTYGYFRSVLSAEALRPLRLEPLVFVDTPGRHVATRQTAAAALAGAGFDAVYLDPPYTKRQYAGNYHVLETIARGDEPAAAGDGGLRPWQEESSDFCSKVRAPGAFEELVRLIDADSLFVSYSTDGLVPTDVRIDILSARGPVTVHQREFPRYRSNSRGQAGDVRELLLEVRVTR